MASDTTALLSDVEGRGGQEQGGWSSLFDDATAYFVPDTADEEFFADYYHDDEMEDGGNGKVYRMGPGDIPRSEYVRFWRASAGDCGGPDVLADVKRSDGVAQRAGFGSKFRKRFKRVLGWMFRTRCCCTREGSLMAVGITLAILGALMNTAFFILFPPIITAVQKRSISGFIAALIPIALVAVLASVMQSSAVYAGQRLAIMFRRSLTRRLHYRYMSRNIYYRMLLMEQRVDNPDQRIVSDVGTLTASVAGLLCGTADQPNGVFGILVPGIVLGFLTATTLGPLALGLVLLLVLVGGSLSRLFIGRVVPLVFRQDRLEGDLRFAHVQVREKAEEIAFLDGHEQQHRSLNIGVRRVLANAFELAKAQLPLNLSVQVSQTISNMTAVAVPAIIFFSTGFPSKNGDEPNTPTQNAKLFDTSYAYIAGFSGGLMGLFSFSQLLSTMGGVTNRLGEMLEVMDDIQGQERIHLFQLSCADETVLIGDVHGDADRLALTHVSAYTPDNVKLATDVTFEVRRGQSLLIMGPSGVGKSSLLRVLGGLWPTHGEGTISRPEFIGRDGLFYLPQMPYIVFEGTVAEQVVYPNSNGDVVDASVLRELLEFFELGHLLAVQDGLRERGEPLHWDNILSGGEKQRLSMARLFYHSPAFAILDECTSAVSEDMEDKFYQRLVESGIGFVSVAHSARVVAYHGAMLYLEGPESAILMNGEEARQFLSSPEVLSASESDTVVSVSRVASSSHGVLGARSLASSMGSIQGTGPGSLSDSALPTELQTVRSSSQADGDVPVYRPLREQAAVLQTPTDTVLAEVAAFSKLDIPDDSFEYFYPFTRDVVASVLGAIEAVDSAAVRSALGVRLFKRMVRLHGLMFHSPTRQATKLFAVGSLCVLPAAAGSILAPLLLSKIVSAVTHEDKSSFVKWMLLTTVISLFAAVITALMYYISAVLAIVSRKSMMRHLHYRYLNGNTYYQTNVTDSRIDNVDQRLTEDVRLYTTGVSSLAFGSPLSGSVLKIGPALIGITIVAWFEITWVGVVMAYGLAVIAFTFSRFVTAPVVPLVFRQDRLVGDLRYAHVRLRDNAESVAFLSGHETEHKSFNQRLAVLLANTVKLVRKQLWLNMYVSLMTYLGVLAGFALPGVLAFLGMLDGDVEDKFLVVYISYNSLYSVATQALHLLPEFAALFGHANRLGDLMELFDVYDHEARTQSVIQDNPDAVVMRDACVVTPAGRDLAQGLSFELRAGDSLFIEGESGVGKSSVLRTLTGLWAPSSGSVERPLTIGAGGVFFLPQNPLLILGSLKEQVVFPRSLKEAPLSDEGLMVLLRRVRLGHLVDRVYAAADLGFYVNWSNLLSGGEKQRLAMARLLFHAPKFAILDECTSAVDEAMENSFYALLEDEDITPISVSHRSNVRQYHAQTLHLEAGGAWALEPTAPASQALSAQPRG